MDLRTRSVGGYSESRRTSYDLSVCSNDDSFETMKTDHAMEKMGSFEVALSSGLKKAVAAVTKKEDADKKENADHGNSSDDEDKTSRGLMIINALVNRSRRGSMETIWARKRKSVPTSYCPPTNPQDPSVDSKGLEDNKSTRRKKSMSVVAPRPQQQCLCYWQCL